MGTPSRRTAARVARSSTPSRYPGPFLDGSPIGSSATPSSFSSGGCVCFAIAEESRCYFSFVGAWANAPFSIPKLLATAEPVKLRQASPSRQERRGPGGPRRPALHLRRVLPRAAAEPGAGDPLPGTGPRLYCQTGSFFSYSVFFNQIIVYEIR